MNPLKTDYKNDELTPSMNGKRHYAIKDSDGITILYPDVILEDVSEYDVHGDEFGKDDINAMNAMANKNYEDNKTILTVAENLDEALNNAEMYANEANLAKNNALMYASEAETFRNDIINLTPLEYSTVVNMIGLDDITKVGTSITNAINNLDDKNNSLASDLEDIIEKTSMITATLSAGSTTITITDSRINTDSYFDFYTSKYGLSPTSVTVNDGVLILTFDAQTEPVTVGVKVG